MEVQDGGLLGMPSNFLPGAAGLVEVVDSGSRLFNQARRKRVSHWALRL